MSVTTLKKLVGEAGAGLDESNGSNRLYDVLKAFAEALSEMVSAHQATIATATIASVVVDKPTRLDSLRTAIGTTGTADSTTVQVHKNGVSQGELTTANTEADGTEKSATLAVDLVAGDLVELVVSAAPTGGAALAATARMRPVVVE